MMNFKLTMSFPHADGQEIVHSLRRLADAIDRTERMVGQKWPGHMNHAVHDRRAQKVGAWIVG